MVTRSTVPMTMQVARAASWISPRRSAKARYHHARSCFYRFQEKNSALWGSKYYSEHPTWNAKKIVADINIDMIGRATQLSGASGISVTPSHRHDKFSTLVQTAARCADALDLSLSSGDIYYERSDHYHFAKLGIPVVFFCDGEHEDYHKVTDTPDKLNYEKMERVARLAFWTGHIVAQDKRRPRDVGAQPGWLPSDN